eukprot:PITA_15353
MRVSLERELKLHVEEELLVPKEEEPQTNAEELHAEDPRVETSTHAESSRDGHKRSRKVDRLVMDVRENVGQPSSQPNRGDHLSGTLVTSPCVWDVVPRPEDKSVVSSWWLYKVNQVADGSVEKHKERFVARGFSQVEGIDYDGTFAPVARYSSIKLMLALSTQMSWKIHQMDVKTAFLNGMIEEEVYIE